VAASPVPPFSASQSPRAVLTVEVPRQVRERLLEHAREQHRSIPGVVRMLIDRFLAEQASQQAGEER